MKTLIPAKGKAKAKAKFEECKEKRRERNDQMLRHLIGIFERGEAPKAISIALFPQYDDIPSAKWSVCNRIIMMSGGTSDARGYRAWQDVGRFVKANEKARIYILGIKRVGGNENESEGGNEVIESENEVVAPKASFSYFFPIPVFAVEQTDGEPLQYKKLEIPNIPLLERAREWGIDVKAVAGNNRWHGLYKSSKSQILLATPHEKVFFHELAHAAHKKVKGQISGGQDPKQEIVAELSAQTLCQLVGTEMESTIGNSYEYILSYATKMKRSVGDACRSVISDVSKVLDLILKEKCNS